MLVCCWSTVLGVRVRPEQRAIQATAWGDWDGGGSTWAGVRVDTQSATQLLTVYAATRFIADSIATLPVDCFRDTGDGRVEITPPMWLTQPTVDLDRTAWLTQILTSLLLDGNAYLWRTYDTDLRLRELIPLDPTKVSVRRVDGRKRFTIAGRDADSFDVLHISGLMFPGADRGMSPVEAARQSIGMGLSAQEYGARFFGQDGTPGGVIEVPTELLPDKAREMANAWARRHSGKRKAHLPGVLEGGATWKATGVTNEQAQFLETRRYTAAEIAGQMFLVDPSELGIGVDGTSLTYANLEQRATRRVQVTLLPWIVRLENAFSAILAKPRFVKFNVNGLLRGDTKTRYETYAIGITNKILDPEEAREFEDLPPRETPVEEPPAEEAPEEPAFVPPTIGVS